MFLIILWETHCSIFHILWEISWSLWQVTGTGIGDTGLALTDITSVSLHHKGIYRGGIWEGKNGRDIGHINIFSINNYCYSLMCSIVTFSIVLDFSSQIFYYFSHLYSQVKLICRFHFIFILSIIVIPIVMPMIRLFFYFFHVLE